MNMRVRALQWSVVLLIVVGVPGLLIWLVMPYLDLARASYLSSKRDFRGAINILNRAIFFNHSLAPAYARRGAIYAQLNMPQEALADFSEALKLNPNDWEPYNNRAWFYAQNHQCDLALKDADKALSNCYNCFAALDTRGVIYMGQGRYQDALSDFSRAISLSSTYGTAYFHRSQCYQRLQDTTAAQKDWRTAQELGYVQD